MSPLSIAIPHVLFFVCITGLLDFRAWTKRGKWKKKCSSPLASLLHICLSPHLSLHRVVFVSPRKGKMAWKMQNKIDLGGRCNRVGNSALRPLILKAVMCRPFLSGVAFWGLLRPLPHLLQPPFTPKSWKTCPHASVPVWALLCTLFRCWRIRQFLDPKKNCPKPPLGEI